MAIFKKNWVVSLLAIAVLLSGTGLITVGAWLSLQLFINPDAAIWVNNLLPKWAQIPLINRDSHQTLKQIQANIRQQGQIPGEPVPLETNAHLQPKSLVLPVMSLPARCQVDCEQIVELRVYKLAATRRNQLQHEANYELVSQVPIQGPEEAFVIAPLVDAETANSGSSRPLPLTRLYRFEGTTPAGVWLYLWGQRLQGASPITYGQVIHYNPERSHLSLMMPWTSPRGIPQWQHVTSGSSPELVVEQTTDLEPQLLVYQVKPSQFLLNPVQLELISLAEPALNVPAYKDALTIARSGLWTPAWQWLQFIKQQRQKHHQPWSAAAQAQMDLIGLYAQFTKNQAEKTWASPSQELLADLIDGHWGKSLQMFQVSALAAMSESSLQEITTLLESDSGRLWNRVEAALRVNPRTEVKAWGALIVGAKEGRRSAIAWLKQQPKTTPVTIAYIQDLLRRLERDSTAISSSHPSRMIGSVEPVTEINLAQWLQPHQKVTLNLPHQQWHQIQINAYHDGIWRRTPFSHLQLPKTAAVKSLWQQLGLNTAPQLQIIYWLPDGQRKTTTATAKAIQLQGGILRLLAVTEGVDIYRAGSRDQPLVITKATLQWLQPEPIPLAELTQQQQPLEITEILPALWQELQKLNASHTQRAIPNLERIQQQLGQWPTRLLDLTGDSLPEIFITVSPEAIAVPGLTTSKLSQGNLSRPITMIFSNTGSLLYSELSSPSQQSVVAIATIEDDQPPALLVRAANTYKFKRWSAQRQRFEDFW